VQVVVALPLADALMVLAPLFALHAGVVSGVIASKRLVQDFVVLEAIERFAERGGKERDVPALQFLFGQFVEIVAVGVAGIDLVLDAVESRGRDRGRGSSVCGSMSRK